MNAEYSAVIIAKNEAIIIGKTIAALKQVTNDIIIVLDDRSSDATNKIALDLGAKVFHKSWEGYSANKNFGVEQAKNDWILCLDADEVLDVRLISELKKLQADDSMVYEMNRQTYFGDYPVKYCGWFPDWNIRLFNKKAMRWNDNFVHEKLVSDIHLKHIRLSGLIQHYSFMNEADMISKFDHYAKLRATEWKNSNKVPSLFKQWFGPLFRFVRTYILKLGILDGRYGYLIAKNEYQLKQKELKYWKEMKGDA